MDKPQEGDVMEWCEGYCPFLQDDCIMEGQFHEGRWRWRHLRACVFAVNQDCLLVLAASVLAQTVGEDGDSIQTTPLLRSEETTEGE